MQEASPLIVGRELGISVGRLGSGASMGRWRPPGEKATALITPEGHARLKAELDDLWRVRRPEVVKALAAAAAEGDRSENAEYTYRKKQLGEIDRRVRYLSKRLESLRVVVQRADGIGKRCSSARRSRSNNATTGQTQRYRIVGPERDRCETR
jgi:transcription elongation factor GreB